MPSNTSSARRYDASRRQADAVARRRRVVDAAHELFLEQGYGETSINEIARRADVSAQTVYAGFESKAGVLAKVVDVVVAGDYAAVEMEDDDDVLLVRDRHDSIEALAHTDLRIRFRAVAHWSAISHARSGPILRLVDSVAGSDPAIAELVAGLIAGVREDIGLAVSEIPVEDLREGIDQALATDLSFHLLGWRAFHTFTVDCGWTLAEYEQHVGDVLIHMLLPD